MNSINLTLGEKPIFHREPPNTPGLYFCRRSATAKARLVMVYATAKLETGYETFFFNYPQPMCVDSVDLEWADASVILCMDVPCKGVQKNARKVDKKRTIDESDARSLAFHGSPPKTAGTYIWKPCNPDGTWMNLDNDDVKLVRVDVVYTDDGGKVLVCLSPSGSGQIVSATCLRGGKWASFDTEAPKIQRRKPSK